jgi:hypothetical protein
MDIGGWIIVALVLAAVRAASGGMPRRTVTLVAAGALSVVAAALLALAVFVTTAGVNVPPSFHLGLFFPEDELFEGRFNPDTPWTRFPDAEGHGTCVAPHVSPDGPDGLCKWRTLYPGDEIRLPFLRNIYTNYATRCPALLIGAVAGLLVAVWNADAAAQAATSSTISKGKGKGKGKGAAAAAAFGSPLVRDACVAAAFAVAAACVLNPGLDMHTWPTPVSRRLQAVLGRPLLALSTAVILACLAGADRASSGRPASGQGMGPTRLLSWLLSLRVWRPLSTLTLQVFLHNTMVIFFTTLVRSAKHGALPVRPSDPNGGAVFFAALIAGTYALAAITYNVIERPTTFVVGKISRAAGIV